MDPDFSVSSAMDQTSDQDPENEQKMSEWMPSGRGLVSGLFGLNVVLLGGALLAGRALTNQNVLLWEPEMMLLLLMALSVVWILWFILWESKRPGSRPHQDHHAGGITVLLVLLLFAGFTVLLCVFRVGLIISLRPCKSLSQVASPLLEIIFLCLQTYLLWAHSKDCIHIRKVITRAGLMVILCTDLLLWLNAVTDDTIHQEIELQKEDGLTPDNYTLRLDIFGIDSSNSSACLCSSTPACLIFQKGFEVLYPFSMEYYLMSGCMIYVMWKNVARTLTHAHHHADNKLTVKIVYSGGIIYGLIFGGLVLIAGILVFILYQVWVGQSAHKLTAFLLFYSYHLTVMPVMSFCSLLGLLVHRFEKRIHDGGHNPTRSLDVLLLIITALGQLALSYFSLVAAIAIGTQGILGDLDLSYSVLSLLELVMQNTFIIEGLHRHPSIKAKKKPRSTMFKLKKKSSESEERKAGLTLLDQNTTAPPADPEEESKKTWSKTIIQEICAFLVLSNIMLWIIPAFGVHPQFENGLGKQFFGFSSWFVLVNVGQPLSVFYRMHSVSALMELLITAK